ncbi:hypothetical protein Tco_0144845 [Tanacetum coccineum]
MLLETSKVYMMIPKKRGNSLSTEDARRLLFRANVILDSGSFVSAYTGFLPLFARMCPAAVVKSKKREHKDEKGLVLSKPPLFRDLGLDSEESGEYFLSRQLSAKNTWKPSLDTIKEKGVKAKIRHWLL